MVPRLLRTGQDVICKNGLKTILIQANEISVDIFFNPIRMDFFINRFLESGKATLKPKIKSSAAGEQRKHTKCILARSHNASMFLRNR